MYTVSKYFGVWFNEKGADWKLHFEKMITKAGMLLSFGDGLGLTIEDFI